MYGGKKITCSDLSGYAIAGLKHWEDLFKVKIDGNVVCKSYDIPLDSSSVDLIFCFAAAHHFRKHRKTLAEIYRVLKPDGYCLYLYEPSCRKYLYKAAYKRVNRIRSEVQEDVLIYKNILRIARETGFRDVSVKFRPNFHNRGPLGVVYNWFLSKVTVLSRFLPSTTDYIFRK